MKLHNTFFVVENSPHFPECCEFIDAVESVVIQSQTGFLALFLLTVKEFLLILQQTVDCIGKVLQFVLGFDPEEKDAVFVGERSITGNYRSDFVDELTEEDCVLLGEEEVGPESGGEALYPFDFVVDFDVDGCHGGTGFGVEVAEDLDVGGALPPSQVDVVVEVVDPRHRLSDSHVVRDHNSSVVGQDADKREVAGDCAVLPHNSDHLFVLLFGPTTHVLFGVGLGYDRDLVASLRGVVLVVFVVKPVECGAVHLIVLGFEKPKFFFNLE